MAANYDIFAGDDDNINYKDMFQDMSVDYLSITGNNYGGAVGKVNRTSYDGRAYGRWGGGTREQSGLATAGYDAHAWESRRNKVLKNNGYQWQKHNASGGLGGFNNEFYRGIGARMSLDTSSRFLLNRMQSDQSTYDTYLADSLKSRAEYDVLTEGMDAQDISFQEQEQNLNTLRGQAQQSTTTTSVGAYAQAARRQMQSTSRYMNTLSGFNAPDAMELNPYFVDPLTGKQRHMTEAFDEDAHYRGFETQEDVRAFVTDEFSTRQSTIYSEIFNERMAALGFSEEQGRSILNDLSMANTNEVIGNSGNTMHEMTDGTYMTGNNLKNLNNFRDTEMHQLRRFSEARTISEMMGNTKGYWSETHQGETTGITGTEGILRALDNNEDFSIESFLEDTSKDSFNRFTVQNINNMEAMRGEYTRRQEAAQSQVTNVELRNQLSQKRQEQVLKQQQKTQQLFEQQQREYQSTLSGLGATDEDMSGNVTFTAVRPQ
tara:strand:+ start:1182 stop:2648 length:1467 start_codon:yes stop_codon:yes gene_type:complete